MCLKPCIVVSGLLQEWYVNYSNPLNTTANINHI